MRIEQNRPLRHIQDMSVFHPWCQGTVGPSHRRNAGSLDLVFLATKNVVRKRLATGRRINPTSWLTLVKLESSSFRELHLKSDQPVVNGSCNPHLPYSPWHKKIFISNLILWDKNVCKGREDRLFFCGVVHQQNLSNLQIFWNKTIWF